MRYRAGRVANYSFGDPMAQMTGAPPIRSGGGWKSLFWLAVGALGLGFAGYVYLGPYLKIQSALSTRMGEAGAERSAAQDALAERDKIKTQMAQYTTAEKEKAAAASKHKGELEAMTNTLKSSLE